MQVLAADIGGTHARLAVVEIEDGRAVVTQRQTYRSNRFKDVLSILQPFLDQLARRPERAALAVAGPVIAGTARLTNLHWSINEALISRAIGIERTRVLNDFHALAHGVPHLGPSDFETLRRGRAEEAAPIAVLGAGTGLGVSFLIHDGTGYRVIPSEGGHMDFGPRDDKQTELFRFLRDRFRSVSGGHVSYERVLSGAGLVALYDFLTRSARADDDPETRLAMDREDGAAVISRRAMSREDAAAVAVLELFTEIYGAMAGCLALLIQARGGVYLSGGIARQNLWALRGGRFEAAFIDKGRLSKALDSVPVRVITNDEAGILGAAYAACAGTVP